MPRDLTQLPAPNWPAGKAPPPSAFSTLAPQDALFVELYRETGDAMASAVRAKMFSAEYPIDVLARKTLDRADIQAAITALDDAERAATQAAQAVTVRQPVEITRDSIMADLQAVYEDAKTEKAFGAAIAAKKVQASALGILKQTVDVNFHMKRAEDLSDEELERIAKTGKTIDVEYEDVTEEGQ